jgi:hypothetical protein
MAGRGTHLRALAAMRAADHYHRVGHERQPREQAERDRNIREWPPQRAEDPRDKGREDERTDRNTHRRNLVPANASQGVADGAWRRSLMAL